MNLEELEEFRDSLINGNFRDAAATISNLNQDLFAVYNLCIDFDMGYDDLVGDLLIVADILIHKADENGSR